MSDPTRGKDGESARSADRSAPDMAAAHIKLVADGVEKRFQRGRRVLSFAEYLELFATDPIGFSRDSSRDPRDAFEHYGTSEVDSPWGKLTRWKLFDLPWEGATTAGGALPRGALIGQERV